MSLLRLYSECIAIRQCLIYMVLFRGMSISDFVLYIGLVACIFHSHDGSVLQSGVDEYEPNGA